jgi:hypothetical protein
MSFGIAAAGSRGRGIFTTISSKWWGFDGAWWDSGQCAAAERLAQVDIGEATGARHSVYAAPATTTPRTTITLAKFCTLSQEKLVHRARSAR